MALGRDMKAGNNTIGSVNADRMLTLSMKICVWKQQMSYQADVTGRGEVGSWCIKNISADRWDKDTAQKLCDTCWNILRFSQVWSLDK